jgi:hypothetical protein
VASDNELFAAYCFGAYTSYLGSMRAQPEPRSDLIQKEITDAEAKASRLMQYLRSKASINRGPGVQASMLAAKKRGEMDKQLCAQALDAGLQGMLDQCDKSIVLEGPYGHPTAADIKALTECLAKLRPESCSVSDRCSDLSRLPF